jgi:hypothetical protein
MKGRQLDSCRRRSDCGDGWGSGTGSGDGWGNGYGDGDGTATAAVIDE